MRVAVVVGERGAWVGRERRAENRVHPVRRRAVGAAAVAKWVGRGRAEAGRHREQLAQRDRAHARVGAGGDIAAEDVAELHVERLQLAFAEGDSHQSGDDALGDGEDRQALVRSTQVVVALEHEPSVTCDEQGRQCRNAALSPPIGSSETLRVDAFARRTHVRPNARLLHRRGRAGAAAGRERREHKNGDSEGHACSADHSSIVRKSRRRLYQRRQCRRRLTASDPYAHSDRTRGQSFEGHGGSPRAPPGRSGRQRRRRLPAYRPRPTPPRVGPLRP